MSENKVTLSNAKDIIHGKKKKRVIVAIFLLENNKYYCQTQSTLFGKNMKHVYRSKTCTIKVTITWSH